MFILFSWLDLSKLDWGSVPDWFGSIGTIAAVFVAIYLPYASNRPKARVTLSAMYYTPQVEMMGYKLSFINAGSTAINVKNFNLGIYGTQKSIYFSNDFQGGVLQPGEQFITGVSGVDLYDALRNQFGEDKVLKLYPRAVDSLGKIYSGKAQNFNLLEFKEDVNYQRQWYMKHPGIAEMQDEPNFITRKID